MAERQYDLTDIDNSLFTYSLTDPDGQPVDVKLNLDNVNDVLRRLVPGLYSTVDDLNPDGSKKLGWVRYLELYDAGKSPRDAEWPQQIPPPAQVETAIRVAMEIPPWCKSFVVRAIISNVYFAECYRRATLKKDSPLPPGSSAPTPELSDSEKSELTSPTVAA